MAKNEGIGQYDQISHEKLGQTNPQKLRINAQTGGQKKYCKCRGLYQTVSGIYMCESRTKNWGRGCTRQCLIQIITQNSE